jgi:cytochrome b
LVFRRLRIWRNPFSLGHWAVATLMLWNFFISSQND